MAAERCGPRRPRGAELPGRRCKHRCLTRRLRLLPVNVDHRGPSLDSRALERYNCSTATLYDTGCFMSFSLHGALLRHVSGAGQRAAAGLPAAARRLRRAASAGLCAFALWPARRVWRGAGLPGAGVRRGPAGGRVSARPRVAGRPRRLLQVRMRARAARNCAPARSSARAAAGPRVARALAWRRRRGSV